jgi:isoaspartyl peptidase/L-asparaginase-like protein (Ntn-hydrolase superfamily)
MTGGANDVLVAVHGGAGGKSRTQLPAAEVAAREEAALAALAAAMEVLAGDGSAREAVVAAVCVLEDSEVLNAGRGAALTSAGTAELSAAVADASGPSFGAVAGCRRVRNPVLLADELGREGRTVLLIGPPADEMASVLGLDLADDCYFITERQLIALQGAAAAMGTVGAVARDRTGALAAATSTGGIAGQRPGRVGDSPICGAGTWADQRTCAVSATGEGEAFVKAVFAHEVHARLLYKGETLADACQAALEDVGRHGGTGGCVAIDRDGHLAMPFTTSAMLRGWCNGDGQMAVGIDPGECEGQWS